MQPHVPGAQFYEERLARARALPEAQRGADVRQWLQLHSVLEAALAAMPEIPASATQSRPLTEALGGDQALAGLLRYVAASFADAPRDPSHPKAALRRLAPQLPPLVRVWVAPPNELQMALAPELIEFVQSGTFHPDDADLEVLTRHLLFAVAASALRQHRLGLDTLLAIQPPLFASGASLDRQLAELAQRCSCRSSNGSTGGAASDSPARLPSAAQLQTAWASLAIQLATDAGSHRLVPQSLVGPVTEQAARAQLHLQPSNPMASFNMGKAAVVNATTGSTSTLHDPLPHFLRGAELARQQGSDFWLARCGWMAAIMAASDSSPVVSPARAASLLQEADAAFARIKAVVPPSWATAAKAERDTASPMRPNIEQHAASSPASWQATIRLAQLPEQQRRIDRVMARVEEQPTCDACGLPSAALKRCSSCGTARYCSKRCQRAAWPEHRAECKAKARGGAGT